MAPLSRFLRCSWPERAALIRAVVLLTAIRVGLRVLPFATLCRLLKAVSRPRKPTRDLRAPTQEQTIWAVEAAGRQFPAVGTCLTRAMAAHVLLARTGHESNLRIGVKRDARGAFDAHAWLEKDGLVLLGDAGRASYTPMPALHGLHG